MNTTATATATFQQAVAAVRDAHAFAMAIRGRGKAAAFADRDEALTVLLAVGGFDADALAADALSVALQHTTVEAVNARLASLRDEAAADEAASVTVPADCPARIMARVTGSIGATTADETRGFNDEIEVRNVHAYSRQGGLETCSTCAPAPVVVTLADAKRTASKTITALDDLHSAVEDASGMLPDRAGLLADVDHATRLVIRARKALADAALVLEVTGG